MSLLSFTEFVEIILDVLIILIKSYKMKSSAISQRSHSSLTIK